MRKGLRRTCLRPPERTGQVCLRRPLARRTSHPLTAAAATTFLAVHCFSCCFLIVGVLIGTTVVGASSSSLLTQTSTISSSGSSSGSSSSSRPPTTLAYSIGANPFQHTSNPAHSHQIGNNEQYPVVTFAPNQRPLQQSTTAIARLASVASGATNSPGAGHAAAAAAAAVSIANSATTASAAAAGISQQQQQQPKSLKFTLIAGKFWKFNISKTNSLTSHRQGELRLHRIISANNYIIDDDNWFQYDAQQQQLFAWPSLATRPSIYYFALLPSGVDIEADGENSVSLDVVANIIVELIRPLYQGYKNDIDQLIDYKFSLEDLNRHSSYPLLLQQIVSVFDTISTKSNSTLLNNSVTANTNGNNHHQQQQQLNGYYYGSNNTINHNSLSTLLKGSKLLSSKFSDYLLINYSYSTDGDFFSLTWSSQPTLANNTISLVSECRLANIVDVVAKLSGSTTATRIAATAGQQQHQLEKEEQEQGGYYIGDERYVIYYPLNAPLANSQAIVPKERGNNALRLTLNGPCQSDRIIEELGIVGRLASNATVADTAAEIAGGEQQSSSSNGNPPDVDDKVADNIVDLQPVSAPTSVTSASAASKVAPNVVSPPGLPSPEAIDLSSTSAQITPSPTTSTSQTPALPANQVKVVSAEPADPKPSPQSPPSPSLQQQQQATTVAATPPSTPIVGSIRTKTSEQIDRANNNESQLTIIETSTEIAPSDDAFVPTLTQATTTTTTAPSTPAEEGKLFEQQGLQVPPLAVQQSKSQPQAKSFANFLESTDNQPITNFTMATTMVPKMLTTDGLTKNSTPIATTSTINANKTTNESSVVPMKEISSESSLNEDFMGILNDVMDYLISVAIPVSIIIGTILLISIFIALCSLCIKKRKSKEFQVRNRFNFRYGSERRVFLKNSSKPVILDADRKSLSSLGATPQHRSSKNTPTREQSIGNGNNNKKDVTYLPMHQFSSTEQGDTTFTASR